MGLGFRFRVCHSNRESVQREQAHKSPRNWDEVSRADTDSYLPPTPNLNCGTMILCSEEELTRDLL